MEEIKYFCDICDKETPKIEVRKIGIRTCASFEIIIELDICKECYEKATKDISTDAQHFEKKKFGSILKLWLSKKK